MNTSSSARIEEAQLRVSKGGFGSTHSREAKRATKCHNLNGRQGVRGGNSDNTRLSEIPDWERSIRWKRVLHVSFERIAGYVLSEARVSVVVSVAAD